MKDLVLLTADKNMQQLLEGLLPRMPKVYATTMRPFSYDIKVHPLRDCGYKEYSDFLRVFAQSYAYAIVILDYEGSGFHDSPAELAETIENDLSRSGWQDKNACIVIEPELENWIWVDSPHLATAIDWESIDDLHQWLDKEGLKPLHQPKPNRPKEAFEQALFKSKMPRSSSIYKEIAEKASFKKCIDVNFHKLRDMLMAWFSTS
jgi:hypothetical protein